MASIDYLDKIALYPNQEMHGKAISSS